MKEKNRFFVSALAAIFIFLVTLSVFVNFYIPNNPENRESDENNNSTGNEFGCRTYDGYSWNETDEACVNEGEKQSRYYINKNSEFCKGIQFLCIEGYEPFYNKNGCGCETIATTQD